MNLREGTWSSFTPFVLVSKNIRGFHHLFLVLTPLFFFLQFQLNKYKSVMTVEKGDAEMGFSAEFIVITNGKDLLN